MPERSHGQSPNRWWPAIICLLLALAVWAIYGQTLRHEFINFDDNHYVYENPAIKRGLDLNGVAWAFTHTHGNNWHPLTSISHMLDCQCFGLKPGGHHLTNVLLHASTAIVLFLVLRNMTGALWRSAFVAAVFALHPLRVESVAWVSERKDVLSGLFFVLTVSAYVHYVRRPFALGRYLLVLLLFTLGLLSKPMLVTLPFVLLLLDYWPLGRISPVPGIWTLDSGLRKRLLLEKIPFLLLAAADCAATVLAQSISIRSGQEIDVSTRMGNALVSYVAYLGQMVYPTGLAIFYPHPGNDLSAWTVGLSALGLLIISAGVVTGWRKWPYLPVGWLWYVGMLVPVIGLMQVGVQARADRYTYLPQIGLYVLLVWGAVDLCGNRRYRRAALGAAAVTISVSLMIAAHVQASYWRSSLSLWSHTLACTSRNPIAHLNLGNVLASQGKSDEGIQHYEQAIQLDPNYIKAHNNLGVELANQGKLEEASRHYERAIELDPDYVNAHNNLGIALSMQGKLDEAIKHYEQVLRLKPDYTDAHINLGIALATQGQLNEATQHFEQAIQFQPDHADAHFNLGLALATQGKLNDAMQHLQQALRLATVQGSPALAESTRARLESIQSTAPQSQKP